MGQATYKAVFTEIFTGFFRSLILKRHKRLGNQEYSTSICSIVTKNSWYLWRMFNLSHNAIRQISRDAWRVNTYQYRISDRLMNRTQPHTCSSNRLQSFYKCSLIRRCPGWASTRLYLWRVKKFTNEKKLQVEHKSQRVNHANNAKMMIYQVALLCLITLKEKQAVRKEEKSSWHCNKLTENKWSGFGSRRFSKTLNCDL